MISRTRLSILCAMALSLFALPALASSLTLNFMNLAPLDEATEGVYEGWAIIDGAPVSTGAFNVNESGQPVEPGTGNVIGTFTLTESIGLASEIKISIEPAGDMDPAPSGLIILSGAVEAAEVTLKAAVPGLDMLASAGARYILATPSDNAVDDMNDDQGIWYLSMPGPMAGLTGLPDLGANWIYEGWIVDLSGGTPMPYTTGTFAGGNGADSNEAGCMGGGPPFPGEDFTAYHCGPVFDLDSGNFMAVISIEPVPDNSPAPFAFKPLAGLIPEHALTCDNNMLDNQTAATFPMGTALIDDLVANETSSWSELKASYR